MNRGIFGAVSGLTKAAITKAQATADNARQMVLNDRPKIAAVSTAVDELKTQTPNAGPMGPAGPAGVAGPTGATGATGTAGPAGSAGPEGARGPKGDTGATGPRGEAGPTGSTGAQGAKGDTGSQGPAGTSALSIDYRDGILVPPVLSLLGSATVDVAVPWNTPFADTAYTITKPQVTVNTPGLLGKCDAILKAGSVTKTGCTVTVTTTAVLAVGNATISVLAFRKG